MAKSTLEKIEEMKEKISQLENKQKKLLQEQKVQERKDRTKRLCQRMGLFESLLPDTITLTDEQFKSFLEKTIITEHSRRILDGLTAQNAATAAPQTTETAAQGNTASTANPTHTAQSNGGEREQDGGNGARVTD